MGVSVTKPLSGHIHGGTHNIPQEVVKAKRVRAKSGPARAYSYGCREPVQGLERIRSQITLAHRYRNQLIEIERTRREQCESVLREICPELVDLDERIAALEDEIESLRDGVKSRRVAERSKKFSDQEAKQAIAALAKGLRELRKRHKEIRTVLFRDAAARQRLGDIDEAANEANRTARKASELYWGTYLLVEDSLKNVRKGRPPRFARRQPGGTISVQIQHGMTGEDAFGCQDSRFRIERVDDDAWDNPSRGARRRKAKTRVWIRIGSDEKKKPLWAVVPVTLHRPIPSEARIKQVKLFEYFEGTHSKWRLVLSLEFAKQPVPDDCAESGTAGIDVGWRRFADGSLRVAYWAGSDGQHGECVLDARLVARLKKVNDLRSIRDTMFDQIKAVVREWVGSHDIPDWLRERLQHLHAWKAQRKLAGVAIAWREARFAGDETIFPQVEAWRKQDRHLYDWESNQRANVLRARREQYRVLAADLRSRYATLAIEKLDLREFQQLPDAEDGDDCRSRGQRTLVSPSELLGTIKQCGAVIAEVNPAYTSQTCSACGHRNADLGSLDRWVCPQCIVKHDRDHNAAVNIMRRASGEVGGQIPEVARECCGVMS